MSNEPSEERNTLSGNSDSSLCRKDGIDPWLKAGVLFGILTIVIHVLICALIRHCAADLTRAVTILLSSCGISVGLKLIYITIRRIDIQELDKDRIYLAVGGLSTIWVSFSALYSAFQIP